jgi:hypothetical protein
LSDLCQNFIPFKKFYVDASHGDDELNITEFMSTWVGAVGGEMMILSQQLYNNIIEYRLS